MSDPIEKPEPPAPNECCESGCEPCVWDTYREALAAWNTQQAEIAQKEKDTQPD